MARFKVSHGLCGLAALLVSAQALAFFDVKSLLATPEFESGETRPVSIALLPAETSVAKAKVVDTEGLVEESTEFGAMFDAEVAELLEAKGYVVKIVSPEQVNADPRLREHVIDAKRRYDEATARIKRKWMKRREVNAGDEVRLLADYLDVDAVAFTHLNVVAATGGRKAVGLLVGIGGTGQSTARMGIVDGHSGVLEAIMSGVDTGSGSKKLEEDPRAEMAHMAELVTHKLPEADPSLRVERQASDEDVLEDLEALLDE